MIDVAIKEINQYSDINVQYSQIKQGRNITGFKFEYSLKNPVANKTKPTFQDKVNGISKSYIEKHARIGESYSQAADRLTKLKNTR